MTRINLKLWHQELILVGVPIGLMLVFVVSLSFLLFQSELNAREVNRSKTVISKADALLKQYFDAGSQLLFFKYTKSETSKMLFEKHLANSMQDFEDLRELLKDDPEGLGKLDELRGSAQEGISLLRSFATRLESGEKISNLESIIIYKQFNEAGIDFTDKQHAFVKGEAEKHRVNEEDLAKSKNLVRGFLLSGLIAALSVGALLVAFMRNTTMRFARLMENTVLLAANQPLLPALRGDDEMARLDRSFRTMADDLAEARQKELEIQKMKQEFLALMSHELRTPLTSLQAVLSLIATGMYGDLSDSGQQRVKNAQSSATRLIMLINDLLDMEKMEAGKLSMSYRDINLADVVEDSVESVRGFAEEHEIVLRAMDMMPVKVLADSDRLVQVMINLLSNAIKFSNKGSGIEIKIAGNGEFTEVQVVDHGAGIPDGYAEKIFEKYEQVPNVKGRKIAGTGLGLPICKAIIEQHGGSIGVRPTEGGGSTFWFSIPCVMSGATKLSA